MADHAALARDYLTQAEAHPSDDPDMALLLATIGNGHALLSVSSQIRQLREALFGRQSTANHRSITRK